MTASWWFLGVSIYGALYTLNAYRPFRLGGATVVPSFFASWLTIELAPHHLVWQITATVVFAWYGAFAHWPAWVGLVICLVSWWGLIGQIRRSRETRDLVEDALAHGLGDDYSERLDDDLLDRHAVGVPRSRIAMAFRFGHRDVVHVKNIEYGPYGRRNRLDVWHHREQPNGRPVLFWIHGGGWIIGHKAQQALPMIHHFARHGWVVVSANYRLSPRASFPDHLVDLKRALGWVREHIDEYGGDPGFVTVTGGSAGGHLAALVGLTANDPEYQPEFEDTDTSAQACVPFYGVYDFTNRFGSRAAMEGWGMRRFLERRVMQVGLADDPEAYAKASPYDRIHADAPPFFVIHGTHDVLAPVGDARQFVNELREVSREPVVYAELPVTQHAFDVFHSIRTAHVIHGVERFATWCYSRYLDRAERAGDSPESVEPHAEAG